MYDHSAGEVKEHFLGFVEADSTTGEALAETVLNTLEEYGIDVNNIRGQGYDGAANMAWKHRGVQVVFASVFRMPIIPIVVLTL